MATDHELESWELMRELTVDDLRELL